MRAGLCLPGRNPRYSRLALAAASVWLPSRVARTKGMEAFLEGIQNWGSDEEFLTSCEAEPQELMKQIDIMVAHKKSEWEGQTHALEACLDVREWELKTLRSQLDMNHKEALGRKEEEKVVLEEEHEQNQMLRVSLHLWPFPVLPEKGVENHGTRRRRDVTVRIPHLGKKNQVNQNVVSWENPGRMR
ncbi:Centrosomal Protein Of 63 Kda [Manis pentadactyla]|nr:Centrosomal Protein Of 63 Kda [Manis pentadactyla]